jgi:hypothetical protein
LEIIRNLTVLNGATHHDLPFILQHCTQLKMINFAMKQVESEMERESIDLLIKIMSRNTSLKSITISQNNESNEVSAKKYSILMLNLNQFKLYLDYKDYRSIVNYLRNISVDHLKFESRSKKPHFVYTKVNNIKTFTVHIMILTFGSVTYLHFLQQLLFLNSIKTISFHDGFKITFKFLKDMFSIPNIAFDIIYLQNCQYDTCCLLKTERWLKKQNKKVSLVWIKVLQKSFFLTNKKGKML